MLSNKKPDFWNSLTHFFLLSIVFFLYQITNIDVANHKISLSIKVMEEKIEKEAMEKYGSKDSGASLGAILGKALGRDKKE